MGLTDTFVKQVKPVKPAGDKYTDGQGMYLLVTPSGKYWRIDYRFLGKRKTLALGVYPEVSLAKARARRQDARETLADGIDPGEAKREQRNANSIASEHTFEAVARSWLVKSKAVRAASTQVKVETWLAKDIFPKRTKHAPQSAQIEVSADGFRTIPTVTGVKLVRDLFEGIGVDRLRANHHFTNLSFSDINMLPDEELTEAIAVGLDYLAAEAKKERSVVKVALAERIEAQLGGMTERLHYRVGRSYSKIWPKPAIPIV